MAVGFLYFSYTDSICQSKILLFPCLCDQLKRFSLLILPQDIIPFCLFFLNICISFVVTLFALIFSTVEFFFLYFVKILFFGEVFMKIFSWICIISTKR